jgi:transitional endoplasmic reticulum ATPase
MGNVVKLKVAEAIQDDVNRGVIRIDSTFMHELDVRPEDIVEIKGERNTLGIVERAYPGDIGLNIIRMDGLVRRNARSGIGEYVEVKKADVQEAKKVVISPLHKEVRIEASPKIFKYALVGRAVLKGDIVSLGSPRKKKSSSLAYKAFFDDVFDMDSMIGFGLSDLKFIVSETQPAQGVIITENTEISYNPEPQHLKEEKTLEVTYEDIGGLHDEVTKVREMVELPLKHPELFERLGIDPPKGVLLYGPPGTGKTLLAKAVANETQANFILINGPEIMSKYYGQSEQNLRKKFEEAEKNAPSIVFIDEIDAIAIKREESHGEVERRVVAQLLALMDGLKSRGKVVVIAASNIPNSLDPALRRPGRFDRELEIGVPDKNARTNILKIHTRNMPLTKDVSLPEIAEFTHGFVGADLYALSKEAAMNVLRRLLPEINTKDSDKIPNEILEKMVVSANDFKEARKVVPPSAMREVMVELPSVKWEDIGGLQDLKQELLEAVEWPLQHPEAFSRLGVTPPKGILIYGPPGTGKTLLAKAVAHESNANFISVKGPELLSKWVNETPQLVKKLFQKAKQVSPCVIFIDEIDSIAGNRDSGQSDTNNGMSAINQLLTEMDGLESLNDIVVIAATNRPDVIDPAILRSGRCDRMILASIPDQKSRLDIFKIHTRDMPLAENISLEDLSIVTDGYVGADIELICREAAVLALRENIDTKIVEKKHFEAALTKVKGSVSKEIIDMYAKFEDQFKTSRGNAIKHKESYFG